MEIQPLKETEFQKLYAERMGRDFPPDELRPLSNIRLLMGQGKYFCLGCYENGGLSAYACFARAEEAMLLDYYAVEETLRGQGVGSRFLGRLRQMGAELSAPFLLIEAESPESAETPEEQKLRCRRIQFYQNCGCLKTRIYSMLFGVEYQILYLPLQEGTVLADSEVSAMLQKLYQTIITPMAPREEQYRKVCRIFSKGGQGAEAKP